ncbi:loganic acid O-methyltransferase-like [Mangifera indica]|uniref:loganic acid O-methyltransferase-like n=1 Tax=Mangifera indica TaxID=29780 RepID=UPI001CF95F00|nr:loganic acid O-methyltransferase-like [Mangifera indica]
MATEKLISSKAQDSEMTTLRDSSPIQVIGGHGTYSYFNNSTYQKLAANVTKEKVDEAITRKLDVKSLLSSSPYPTNTIRLVDCGCAVGPNTFDTMQDLIETIKEKYKSQCPDSAMPEFQVFFNDQTYNDFNTLFTSLPQERQYFVAGVPGSFHQRLFPECFVHVVHVSHALHWLSTPPEELVDRASGAWNKGRIHYAFAPEEVVNAYANQFARDFDNFLNARAKEIVPEGIIVISNPSIPDGMPISQIANGLMYDCMGDILNHMVKEGLISEAHVDTFNLPVYSCPLGEFTALIERNGNFSIEAIGLTNPSPWLEGRINMPEFVKHIRAAFEGMFSKHFPLEICEEMYRRLVERLEEINDEMTACYRDGIQLYAVLQPTIRDTLVAILNSSDEYKKWAKFFASMRMTDLSCSTGWSSQLALNADTKALKEAF